MFRCTDVAVMFEDAERLLRCAGKRGQGQSEESDRGLNDDYGAQAGPRL